jgi:hypothetical protein
MLLKQATALQGPLGTGKQLVMVLWVIITVNSKRPGVLREVILFVAVANQALDDGVIKAVNEDDGTLVLRHGEQSHDINRADLGVVRLAEIL